MNAVFRERDVIASAGASRFMNEKYRAHSDGFTEYICSCGKSAVCNIEKCIYKCNYCRDNANIYAAPVSWSGKLFIQELESIKQLWKEVRNNFLVSLHAVACFAKHLCDSKQRGKTSKLLEHLIKL